MKPNSQSSIFQVGEVASRGYRNKKWLRSEFIIMIWFLLSISWCIRETVAIPAGVFVFTADINICQNKCVTTSGALYSVFIVKKVAKKVRKKLKAKLYFISNIQILQF